LDLPVKFGVGAYLGNGQQYYPWIHIDDVCQMIIYALFKPLNDIYNAVAPQPVTNKELVKTIAKVKGRPFIPAPGPKFVLNLVMGEMAAVLLNSQNVSSKKIEAAGFVFQFPELETALEDIYKRRV
jgi:NAD dependent epimerase/dehydratase family enzyme